jgi:ribosome-associated toxin RatA of RatAB toxin-antitoxin module
MAKTPIPTVAAIALLAAGLADSRAGAEPGDPEVLTSQIPEVGSDIAWGHAALVLDRPMVEVIPIIRDYANYVQFMPNFTKSKVLAQRGGRARVYMEVSIAKGAFTLWGQLDLAEHAADGDAVVVDARLMEGNIDAFNASWTLTPIDGGARTRVDFRIYVDPDIPLPSAVFSRENERAAAKTVRALRARVFDAPSGST